MELILFMIAIMANMIHGRSYENVSEIFAYSESEFENFASEKVRDRNISKRSYNSEDKSICWLTGPSFALRTEEELLYQPYENQTDIILTSRDCLSHPVKITLNHKNLSTKVLHFFIFNQLYVYMDNQTIFRSRRNIVSRLFCKKGHSTIVFSLSNRNIKVSYKNSHRFGKRCPKSFLNNAQIYNYRDSQRRIPHMDLLFGIMIILVILVTCFLRLIYWFRIKALSQQRQVRAQQRRNLIDLTRPGRVNRRIELPPSYNDIQQQEEPPPSYDAVYKRLLETSETPPFNYKDNCDGESPRQECISDPPPEYYELYDNLTAINEPESTIGCQIGVNTLPESNSDDVTGTTSSNGSQISGNTLPESNSDEVTGTTSSNYGETSFAKCDQVHIDLEDMSKTDQTNTIVDDKIESVSLDPKVNCTRDEVNLEDPLSLSDSEHLDIACESIVFNERESTYTELSIAKSNNDPVNV